VMRAAKPTEADTKGRAGGPEKIHVAFVSDSNYAECTGVAAYSVCQNMAPEDSVVIHVVMTEPFTTDHRKKFRQLERIFAPRVKIVFYDDPSRADRYINKLKNQYKGETWSGRYRSGTWPISSCYKLLVPVILPPTLSKVICLDGDLLVLSSLKGLWHKLPCENYMIAAALKFIWRDSDFSPDAKCDHPTLIFLRSLGGIRLQISIDSGVMLWDLFAVHQHLFMVDKAIDWLLRYKPPFTDQDTLNVVFQKHILPCDSRWNMPNNWLPPAEMWKSIFSGPSRRGAVTHYEGCLKPWVLYPHEVIKQRRRTWISYLFLRPPTLWHRYRQESPWRHSLRSRFRELFATPEDRKLFKPAFIGIAVAAAIALPSALYGLCRLFSSFP